MCFNVFNELQEDKLDTLAVFIEHGKMINENLGGSGKLFQDLVFLVRDCQFWGYVEDKNGGKKYLDTVLGPNDVQKLQQVRDILNASYERKHGFVFPYPGDKVARTKTSKISEIDPLFVTTAQSLIQSLCSDLTIRRKKIGSTFIHCGEMQQYISNCVQTFDDNKKFAPQAIQAVNREYMLNIEGKRATEMYEELMNVEFGNCKTGFAEENFKSIDTLMYTKVEADIMARIKEKEISCAVLKKFLDNHENLFKKYAEKNNLLVEKEAERLRHKKERKEQQIFFDEKLCQEKIEREIQMRKLKNENDERAQKLIKQQISIKKDFELQLKKEKENFENEKRKEAEKREKEKKKFEKKIKENKAKIKKVQKGQSFDRIAESLISTLPAVMSFASRSLSGESSYGQQRNYASSRGGLNYNGPRSYEPPEMSHGRGQGRTEGGGHSVPACPPKIEMPPPKINPGYGLSRDGFSNVGSRGPEPWAYPSAPAFSRGSSSRGR
uniref:Guanylate-binding protein N-terminal domain-containing protein n=1 Tax=Panagrolaimus sp. ES5 TaxID=591445 RepID=A0AC34FYB6_9BILA